MAAKYLESRTSGPLTLDMSIAPCGALRPPWLALALALALARLARQKGL